MFRVLTRTGLPKYTLNKTVLNEWFILLMAGERMMF